MTPAKVDVNHSITDSLVTQPVTHSNEDEFMQRLVGRSALDLLTEGLSPAKQKSLQTTRRLMRIESAQ
ncbi:MAG: hypothetical protein Q7J10_03025 [Methanosarcinaceae archaeon]|nr:hypothetical protein [Methanosarcinaceae archaeon]